MSDTPQLTHEQATLLRVLIDQDPYANNMLLQKQFELIKTFLDYAGQHHYVVNQKGREALTAYDREWVTVRRGLLRDLVTATKEAGRLDGGLAKGYAQDIIEAEKSLEAKQ